MRCHIRHIGGDARNQPTAADGHDDGIDRGALGRKLRQDLRGHGALADDRIAGIEGLDEGGVALGGIGMRGGRGLVKVGTHYYEFHLVSAVHVDAVALLHGRGLRDENLARNPHGAARIGHALCMVACRCRHDAPLPLLLRQAGDAIERAAYLIRAHVLEILAL